MAYFSSPVFRIFHWGPLIALGIIFSVSICTVSCLGQWHNSREAFLDLAASLRGGYRRDDIITGSTSKNMIGGLDAETNTAEANRDEGGSSTHTPTFWSRASPYFLISFLTLSGSTLYCYLNAMWGGPGTVPPGWHPPHPEERACLQYCSTCCSYKPPRAHHCRQCGRCILKMDHHCPWINTCVGHANHTHFTLFLAFAVAGCSLASCVMGPSVYWALYRRWYLYYGTGDTPIIFLSLWGLLLHMFVLGLAIGVVVAVGLLLYFQARSILRNRTAIEDWILEKANHRRVEVGQSAFLFPYDLGRWDNVRQVFASVWCRAKGDGITWTVRPGATQYTLTVEQLEQKACKRARAVRCVIRRPYSGRWLPVTHGFGVCCHPPCTDEPRITLQEDDIVMVTRWKTYWLYGDCIPRAQLQQEEEERQRRMHDQFSDADTTNTEEEEADSSSNKANGLTANQNDKKSKTFRHRGWFPRHCAVPLLEDVYRQSVPEREQSDAPRGEQSAVERFEEENMRRLRSRDHGEVVGVSRRTRLGRYPGKVGEVETRFLRTTPSAPKQGLYSNRSARNYSLEHMEDAVDGGETSTLPPSSATKNSKKRV